MNPKYQSIIAEFHWARGLCLDLLKALHDEQLHNQPVPKSGSWGKQFRHLGRVQENYIQAIKTGTTIFSPEGCTYSGQITKTSLLEYLKRLDDELLSSLHSPPPSINWFGEIWSVERHLQAMISHEILHHGQLILYARVGGVKLPKSWEAWGE